MLRFAVPLAAVFGALGAACGPAEPDLADFWVVDLERAREIAVDSGRPMLVVFR